MMKRNVESVFSKMERKNNSDAETIKNLIQELNQSYNIHEQFLHSFFEKDLRELLTTKLGLIKFKHELREKHKLDTRDREILKSLRKRTKDALDTVLLEETPNDIFIGLLEITISDYFYYKKYSGQKIKLKGKKDFIALENSKEFLCHDILNLYSEVKTDSISPLASGKILIDYNINKTKFLVWGNNMLGGALGYKISELSFSDADTNAGEKAGWEKSQAFKDSVNHTELQLLLTLEQK